ncbi:MAG: hypothetical protein SO173_09935 [Lachnospiraceae bacterium]|nr:hypothetical protein [Clostridium sp.]MDD6179764.1 hypothetical protein [Clostridium sp.]MDY4821956.1 hypothetical protein [Lachnospiraceae bacterium]MEE0397365.1 hypothetical protein [Lachnospiraceae bacterium]
MGSYVPDGHMAAQTLKKNRRFCYDSGEKEKNSGSQNNLERNKKTEVSADLLCFFCNLRLCLLLSALGRMDYGISEL